MCVWSAVSAPVQEQETVVPLRDAVLIFAHGHVRSFDSVSTADAYVERFALR